MGEVRPVFVPYDGWESDLVAQHVACHGEINGPEHRAFLATRQRLRAAFSYQDENDRLRDAATKVVEMLQAQSNPRRDGGSQPLVEACYELADVLFGVG